MTRTRPFQFAMVVIVAAAYLGGCDSGTAGSTGGAGGDGGGGGVSAPPIKRCRSKCTYPADCGGSYGIEDADNFSCDEGVCKYQGCNSAQECNDAKLTLGLDCVSRPDVPYPVCVRTCSDVTDCAGPNLLYDEDNYLCNEGLCEHTGCNSNEECAAGYGDPIWACGSVPGRSRKDCYRTCKVAADCTQGTAAYDEDNFACNEGRCEYTGCNIVHECIESHGSNAYLCQ